MATTTDVIRKMWYDNEGVSVEVKPDADALDMVRVCTSDPKSQEYFGKFDFNLTPEMARSVARAMIACANEIEPEA